MDYQNQLCGGCGLPLREGEDIVVCPECGTPQHRACFEKENRCVNADRHGESFVWAGSDVPAAEKATFPCPVCRHENPVGADVCSRCGQPFSEKALHLDAPPTRREMNPAQLMDELFFDAPKGVTDLQLEDDERQQVEYVLSQRMLQASPGMTEAQTQERLCGHPLRQVMTFISSHALTYVRKFRKLENGQALTWNWAAFFLTPYWFFFRKLYKPGIIVLTLRICLSLVMYQPMSQISDLMMQLSDAMRNGSLTDEMYLSIAEQISAFAPAILISTGVLLLLAVVSGLLADRLYHRHVKTSLDKLKQSESRDAFLVSFLRKSAVSPLLAALSYVAISVIPTLVLTFFLQ